MEAKEAAYIKNWEQKHGKGKWSYLLLSSVVWGGLLMVAYYTFRLAFNGLLTWFHLMLIFRQVDFWSGWLLLGFLIFCIEGLLWQLAYRKYLSFKRKQSRPR